MYSFFHDLAHNAMFVSRAANARWGHVLGFFLFTPYRWWQRRHSLHHANTGNLDKRGPGEIHTMTVSEYARASRLRRIGYRAYRNPLLLLLVGPSLVFLFERRFPQRAMSRRMLGGVVLTNLALAGWAIGLSALVGWQAFLLIQGTTLVAGGAVAAWMRARIPNYRLRAAHEEQPIFARTPVVTVRSSLAALRLKLWDERRGCLVRVPYGGLRRRDAGDRDAVRAAGHVVEPGHVEEVDRERVAAVLAADPELERRLGLATHP
jgi:omega-6 fatty acid desaturase (delta-12 desaturase)